MAPQSCPCAFNSHGVHLPQVDRAGAPRRISDGGGDTNKKSLPSLPMTGSVVPGNHPTKPGQQIGTDAGGEVKDKAGDQFSTPKRLGAGVKAATSARSLGTPSCPLGRPILPPL
jgi:hypothetical protein